MPILSSFGGASIRGFQVGNNDSGLFNFTTATFTSPIQSTPYSTSATIGACGYGPTQAELQTYYNTNSTTLANLLTANVYFKVPYNGYQWFVVPQTGNYQIVAQGGQGGTNTISGAKGCKLTATFALTQGDILWIAVGHSGGSGHLTTNDWCSAAGGGCTIVAKAPSTGGTTLSNITTCLICAAGGKGAQEARFGPPVPTASSSANGTTGAGFTGKFKAGSNNGAYGGYGGYYAYGGFGGGTASDDSTGNAGGYDAYVSTSPNSFIDSTGTSITRLDAGDTIYPNAGYVIITKL